MEEDIKIIEEFIEDVDSCGLSDCACGLEDKETKCNLLRNLLKRYKELEEGCKTCVIRNDLNDYVENTIPISLIQNKIDKIQESMNKANPSDLYYIEYCEDRIKVLQELLEERNK